MPVTLVLITPELSALQLKTFDKDNGYGLEHALWANDPQNRANISLKNILQNHVVRPDGTTASMSGRSAVDGLKALLTGTGAGTFHYPIDGLSDPKAKDLWWTVERGYSGALKNLQAAAAKKSPIQADAVRILDAVKAGAATRQDELIAAPATLETYEAIEGFLAESEGLDTKKALARLKELKASKELKDELKARDIYQQCQTLISSPKPDSQKAGKENLATLAKKMPDTVYGKKAAGGK